ncbi:anti-sigma factor family protein [Amycolatopsis sp. CA-230715]|uniref:anti-sigma factor family protein n=1 Tax=Amycolatopsis sp. CA-230715 TaxID=2745196 RepID=UPI001C02D7A9|nr:hypothetical protein [Amycolatopsis sp. CA-230715]QWF79215.1 hypothetical protein HUW46_02622 [Amycolatopsis sp. CA-230715]
MSESKGWSLGESHLLPDAVVAFVDGELSLGAQDRASSHVSRCPLCAAEVTAQRQARAEVKRAEIPTMSAGFLASLKSIPQHTDLPSSPDNLAISEDGTLVAIQRPDRVAGLRSTSALGSSTPLGSSSPLGNSSTVLGGGAVGRDGASNRRRAAQGAGVVVSGLVLSALALVVTSGGPEETPQGPGGGPQQNVLRAQFGGTGAVNADVTPTPAPSRPPHGLVPLP